MAHKKEGFRLLYIKGQIFRIFSLSRNSNGHKICGAIMKMKLQTNKTIQFILMYDIPASINFTLINQTFH